jgi:hypothetical protein
MLTVFVRWQSDAYRRLLAEGWTCANLNELYAGVDDRAMLMLNVVVLPSDMEANDVAIA